MSRASQQGTIQTEDNDVITESGNDVHQPGIQYTQLMLDTTEQPHLYDMPRASQQSTIQTEAQCSDGRSVLLQAL